MTGEATLGMNGKRADPVITLCVFCSLLCPEKMCILFPLVFKLFILITLLMEV